MKIILDIRLSRKYHRWAGGIIDIYNINIYILSVDINTIIDYHIDILTSRRNNMTEHELLKIIDNELSDCRIEYTEDNPPGQLGVIFYYDEEED